METNQQLSPAKAEFMARQKARQSFREWCIQCGFQPAKHHELVIAELQSLTDKLVEALNKPSAESNEQVTSQQDNGLRLMILMPPGTAKSTYASKLFPPWFLAQVTRLAVHDLGILACSHNETLAEEFGAAARNFAETNERWLGYSLRRDTRSAGRWGTSKNGFYKAAGVGSGIAGRRMHLGLIDDFCGKEEDVNNKAFNDKTYNWYVNDFVVRLQPNAARVLICNHRNEDDLAGRLMAKEAARWRIVRLRLLIETAEQVEQDPLKRSIGERIWPEYFTAAQVKERMENPSASGIEQQEPTPQKGNDFQAEWFLTYEASELPRIKRLGNPYGASDHAVRTGEANDCSCLGIGWWSGNILYIDPDIIWERIKTDRAVDEMMRYARQYKPLRWWAEKENISGSIGPFLKKRMQEDACWMAIDEVPHMNKDLRSRSQSIIGLMANSRVRFPGYAGWYNRAKHECLTFPNGKHDDFISFIAHLGRGVSGMIGNAPARIQVEELIQQPFRPTMRWLKDSDRSKRLRIAAMIGDN